MTKMLYTAKVWCNPIHEPAPGKKKNKVQLVLQQSLHASNAHQQSSSQVLYALPQQAPSTPTLTFYQCILLSAKSACMQQYNLQHSPPTIPYPHISDKLPRSALKNSHPHFTALWTPIRYTPTTQKHPTHTPDVQMAVGFQNLHCTNKRPSHAQRARRLSICQNIFRWLWHQREYRLSHHFVSTQRW
jgi:hypothetical protein